MKITMYELLGMVKDGKTPKKIKYDNRIYTFDDTKDNYYENETCSINWDYVVIYCLNEEVEIIEDIEEKKIPDKLYKYMEYEDEGCYENILKVYDGGEYEIKEDMSFVIDKINEIIDYLKIKGE